MVPVPESSGLNLRLFPFQGSAPLYLIARICWSANNRHQFGAKKWAFAPIPYIVGSTEYLRSKL